MKTIEFKDINEKVVKGEWNSKFYSSAKSDKSLSRLYVNNNEYYITQEERKKIEDDMGITDDQRAYERAQKLYSSLLTESADVQAYLLEIILDEAGSIDSLASNLLKKYQQDKLKIKLEVKDENEKLDASDKHNRNITNFTIDLDYLKSELNARKFK